MGCMVGDAGEVLWGEGLARRRRRGREVLVMVMAVAVAGCRRPAPAAYVRRRQSVRQVGELGGGTVGTAMRLSSSPHVAAIEVRNVHAVFPVDSIQHPATKSLSEFRTPVELRPQHTKAYQVFFSPPYLSPTSTGLPPRQPRPSPNRVRYL